MVNVAIMGIAGRMGGSIFHLLQCDPEIKIVGATERNNHESIGKDVGELFGSKSTGLMVSDDIKDAALDADLIVDFTSPDSTLRHAEFASKNKKAMIIGTTGLNEEQNKMLSKLAESIPCVYCPNMSIGVNVLFEISKQMASLLGNEFDVEIIEAHHRNKVDSPSGTAIELGRRVAEGLDLNFDNVVRFERHGNIGKRNADEIGIQTIRGGDIVGQHTVMFLGNGESIELTHRAYNRENFSRGVVRAIKWLPGKSPGLYTMKDVLGL